MKKLIPLSLIGILCLCGCSKSQSMGKDYIPYVPPTLVATAVNTPTVSPIQPIPAAIEKDCENMLSYVDDVTIPDGTSFAPGEEVVKTWRVENSGTCKWGQRYTLRYQGGSSMGAAAKQELPSIAPGTEGNITITFTAPEYEGSYYSSWIAYDDQGNPFGDDVYVEIYVDPTLKSDEADGSDDVIEIQAEMLLGEE